MEWPVAALSPSQKYTLISDCVVPRPIAWISTRSEKGVVNVAPFSYFNIVSSEPLIVSVSVNRHDKDGRMKDTARNLLETGDCVVHLPSREHAFHVNATGAGYAPHQSEADELGLALMPAAAVQTQPH